MAFELYGMLAGNVSPRTGENVMPAYGGEEEVFLRKVVTPIYEVIRWVHDYFFIFEFVMLQSYSFMYEYLMLTYLLLRKQK